MGAVHVPGQQVQTRGVGDNIWMRFGAVGSRRIGDAPHIGEDCRNGDVVVGHCENIACGGDASRGAEAAEDITQGRQGSIAEGEVLRGTAVECVVISHGVATRADGSDAAEAISGCLRAIELHVLTHGDLAGNAGTVAVVAVGLTVHTQATGHTAVGVVVVGEGA